MVFSLLRRYLQVYWLKPFDAVNDTANALALRQFPWDEPILEVGGGDGVFSFIMHDGEFIFTDDRYDQSNPRGSGDIFDVYGNGLPLTIKQYASRSYEVGVDLKRSHVLKCRETGVYRSLVVSPPEPLPFASASFKTVFLYFPHGLIEKRNTLDYERALKEMRRVLRPDGTLLMTAVNRTIADYFVCYPLHQFFKHRGWEGLANYFKHLDGGRYVEITRFGRTYSEWEKLLRQAGFTLVEATTQVTPLAWQIYDFQTRPALRQLIYWSWFLRRVHLKRIVKGVWIYTWLPLLVVFYLAFARPRRLALGSMEKAGVFFAFRAIPT